MYLPPSRLYSFQSDIFLYSMASKMNHILRCDWQPDWARWSYLARSRLPVVFLKKISPKAIQLILYWPTLFGKSDGYWPRSFYCELMDLNSVSVHKHAKKNLADIQPSWPHTWSITHMLLTRNLVIINFYSHSSRNISTDDGSVVRVKYPNI